MTYEFDQDGIKHMPKPLCTYADHSYPAYTKEQMRLVIDQRDELLAALKVARNVINEWNQACTEDVAATFYADDELAFIDAAIEKGPK